MNSVETTFKTFSTQDDFTVKASTNDLILLSKFLANLKSQFTPINTSNIMHNKDTKTYFVFIHFSNDEMSNKLQEISAFPKGV